MLRSSTRVLLNASRSSELGNRSAYEVLGVTRNTPFHEVKSRYHQLTQHYHPDMPHGDPTKFREINAAYRLLRSNDRETRSKQFTGTGAASENKQSSQGTSSAFYSRYEKQEREARQREDRDRRNPSGMRRQGFMGELLWVWQIYEMAIIAGAGVVVLGIAIQRYFTVMKYTREKEHHHWMMDKGMPPQMPLEVDEKLKERYSDPITKDEAELDNIIRLEEAAYRRATQRRFDDFREFMFIYDPDYVTSRKLTSTRYNIQYVDESLIPKRCTHVIEFNSDLKGHGFDSVSRTAMEAIEGTHWSSVDAGNIAALVVKGLGSIPANSPNTAKWTFVQYKSMDKSAKNAAPECMIALKNNRFGRLGMCQDVLVTGKEEFQPLRNRQREQRLKAGTIKKKDLVTGGVLPLKDVKTTGAVSPVIAQLHKDSA